MQNIKPECEKLHGFSFSLFSGDNDTFKFQGRTTKQYSKYFIQCLLFSPF